MASPNEHYVAFRVHKLVEWYQDGLAREGRASPTGNYDVNHESVEDVVGYGDADDTGVFTMQGMDFKALQPYFKSKQDSHTL